MPRLSKHRGKSSASRGISNHKVCILSAVDTKDNIIFEIMGTGPETKDMASKFSKYISENGVVVTDMKQAYCDMNISKHIEIKSAGHVNDEGYSLSSINQLHSEFNTLYKKYHGVSLRHLQGYLDFFSFCKQIKYRIEKIREKIEYTYTKIVKSREYITVKELSKKVMPIDVAEVYAEYASLTDS